MPMPSLMQENYPHTTCTQCNDGELQDPENGREWYLVCKECNAIHLVYQPLPHQEAFHNDNSKVKAFFGGYG